MAGRFHRLIMPGATGRCAFCPRAGEWVCAEPYSCGPLCGDHLEHDAGAARPVPAWIKREFDDARAQMASVPNWLKPKPAPVPAGPVEEQ